ncbi:hypothetical protein C9374_013272 [Naegleria lovaniensis]|uniref:Uncharacterized protein n=1 Tax=Naegleria lovaniensis TaxID=51637 RepID=A0AA88H1Y7_NAELO|nr:uncharacterized protein C9374_013272 [Naegleria lovaniensis]KAG2391787.1 hypothetical protein C9374_013272 [Naegleria lovaniensis]
MQANSKPTNKKGSIEKKVLALKERNEILEGTNTQLSNIITQQQQEIRTLETALELASGQDAQQFYNFGAYQLENQKLREEFQRVQAEMEQLHSEKESFENELEIKKQEIAELEMQKENLMSLVDNQNKELSALKNVSEMLKEKASLLKRSDSELVKTRKELESVRSQFQILEKDYANERELREQAEKRFDDLKQSSENETGSLREQLDTFADMNFKYQKQLNELKSENVQMREMSDTMTLKTKELEEVIKLLKEERKSSEEELCNRLKERISQLTQLNGEKDAILNSQKELQFKLMEKEEALRLKEDHLNKLEQQITNQGENKKIMQKTLLQQLETLRREIQEKDTEISNLKEYIDNMEKDNNKLKILVKALKRNQEQRSQLLGKEKGITAVLGGSSVNSSQITNVSAVMDAREDDVKSVCSSVSNYSAAREPEKPPLSASSKTASTRIDSSYATISPKSNTEQETPTRQLSYGSPSMNESQHGGEEEALNSSEVSVNEPPATAVTAFNHANLQTANDRTLFQPQLSQEQVKPACIPTKPTLRVVNTFTAPNTSNINSNAVLVNNPYIPSSLNVVPASTSSSSHINNENVGVVKTTLEKAFHSTPNKPYQQHSNATTTASRKPLALLSNHHNSQSMSVPSTTSFQQPTKKPFKHHHASPQPTPHYAKTLDELAATPSPFSNFSQNKKEMDMSVLSTPTFQRMDLFELAEMK